MRQHRIATLVATVIVLSLGIFAPSHAERDEEAKNKDIRHLMEVSGDVRAMRQTMIAMVDQLRPVLTDLPDEYWDEFKAAIMTDELPELMVPVYARHFTHDQILQLIEFYESPLGRLVVEKQPLIQLDAMGVGQNWGSKKAVAIMERLKEQGAVTETPDEESPEQ